DWKPTDPNENWTYLPQINKADGTVETRDWRWQAGVYQHGAQRVALNRPAAEDEPEMVPAGEVEKLLTGLKVEILKDA
ncbi:hypothetical protein, partial [Campylobacter jejuni]|uniref:hypothetical protein n=1 Tax=Campylobacter jejuni TaxID=197 RepID=UPI001E458BC6